MHTTRTIALVAAFIAAAGAVGCGNALDASTHTDDLTVGVTPTDALDVAVLGQGRNNITQEVRGQCLTAASPTVIPRDITNLTMDSQVDAATATSQLGFEAGAKAKFKLFSGSARAKFARNMASSSLSMTFVYVYDWTKEVQQVDPATMSFIVPPGSITNAQWIERCGDTFMNRREVGGQFYLLYRIDFASESDKTEFSGAVQGSYGPASLQAKVDSVAARFASRSKIHVEVFQAGGDGTKLPGVISGNNTDPGRVITECSLSNLAPCRDFVTRAVNYVTTFAADAKVNPIDRTYVYVDYPTIGVPVPARFEPLEIATTRTFLNAKLDEQLAIKNRIETLLQPGLSPPPDLAAQLPAMQLANNNNLTILQQASLDCWDRITDPADPVQIAACTAWQTKLPGAATGWDGTLSLASLAFQAPSLGTFATSYGTMMGGQTALIVIQNVGTGTITNIGGYCLTGAPITSGLVSSLAPGATMTVQASINNYGYHCSFKFYGTNATNSPYTNTTW